MKLLNHRLQLFRLGLLHFHPAFSAVQYLGHSLLVFPDSFDEPAPVILEGRDLLCRCESAAVQCVCHCVIVDLAMEVAEQVQISRQRWPLLSTKWIYPA